MWSKRSVAIAMLLALNGSALRALADDQPPELPRVQTLEDLRGLKPVKAGDWDVRVGMSDGGAEAGPWELVYCFAVHTRKPEPRFRFVRGGQDAFLGPLLVRVANERFEMVLEQSKTDAGVPPKEALFCQIVLLPAKGNYRVEVLGSEGEALYRSRIAVAEPRPCYWQPFAEVRRHDGQRLDVLSQDAPPARARYSGLLSVLPESVPKEAAEKRDDSKPRNRLPGAVPLDPRWSALGSIELSAADGRFTVRSNGTKMVLRPDQHLLARWWVNDKPVVPRRDLVQLNAQQQEQLRLGEEMSVPLGLPRHLGELKPGDRVALQVMYVPARHQPLPPEGTAVQEMLQKEVTRSLDKVPPVPLLSNRIKLEVTKELLAARVAE